MHLSNKQQAEHGANVPKLVVAPIGFAFAAAAVEMAEDCHVDLR